MASDFVLGISCLNSGFGAAGKAVSRVDQAQVIPPRETRKNYFQKKRLILISDGFPGMEAFRVLTAAEQVGEYLRAELCRGAWGGRMPGGSRLATELGVGGRSGRNQGWLGCLGGPRFQSTSRRDLGAGIYDFSSPSKV